MAKRKPNDIEVFKPWIVERGAELLIPTNQYELVRWRGVNGVSIIYENQKGHKSFVGDAQAAWMAYNSGDGEYRAVPRSKSKTGAKLSVMLRSLIGRDGNFCFYCGTAFDDETPPTKEHLVSRTAGGPDHEANIFLACRACNAEVGHLSASKKIRFRDRKRRGIGTTLLRDIRQHLISLNILEHAPAFVPLVERLDRIIHHADYEERKDTK